MGKCKIIEIIEHEEEIVIIGAVSIPMFQFFLKHYSGLGFGHMCLESAKKHKAAFVFKKGKQQ